MTDVLTTPLQEFHQDLDRLENLVKIIESLRGFGASSPPEENGDGDFGENARTLRIATRNQSADFPILAGTLTLYLAGRFEHFVRVAFEITCDAFASRCQKFNDLPEKMRKNLIYYTATVLDSPAKYGFDELSVHAFVLNLARNLEATAGLGEINSACLSITTQNMTPVTLADLFKRIGFQALWPEMSKQSQMKIYFELERDQDVEHEAKAILENLMTTRNTIAHPSGSPEFPDTNKVSSYISFLKILSSVLVEACRVQLAAFRISPSIRTTDRLTSSQ
jgi:hypothetical protein